MGILFEPGFLLAANIYLDRIKLPFRQIQWTGKHVDVLLSEREKR